VHRQHRSRTPVGAALTGNVVGFRTEDVRKKNIRITAGRSHHVVADNDEFALRSVAQDLIRRVGIGMLVNHGVAAGVHDHLDVVIQLLDAAHTVSNVGHVFAANNSIRPHKDRNRRFDRVLADRQINSRKRRVAFCITRVRTRQADLT